MSNKASILRSTFGGAAKIAVVLTVLFGPIMAAQNVNASAEQSVGELQKMSSGAGLVLVMGLQRG